MIKTGADFGELGGGDSNEIGMNAYDAVIGGGARQMIGPGSIYAGVFGGNNNMVVCRAQIADRLLPGFAPEIIDWNRVVLSVETPKPVSDVTMEFESANRFETQAT